jgi:hypothetical protein
MQVLSSILAEEVLKSVQFLLEAKVDANAW